MQALQSPVLPLAAGSIAAAAATWYIFSFAKQDKDEDDNATVVDFFKAIINGLSPPKVAPSPMDPARNAPIAPGPSIAPTTTPRDALARITEMQQFYGPAIKAAEMDIAKAVVVAAVAATGIKLTSLGGALLQQTAGKLITAMQNDLIGWTDGLVNAQKVENATQANVDVVAAIYKGVPLPADQAQVIWKQKYATWFANFVATIPSY